MRGRAQIFCAHTWSIASIGASNEAAREYVRGCRRRAGNCPESLARATIGSKCLQLAPDTMTATCAPSPRPALTTIVVVCVLLAHFVLLVVVAGNLSPLRQRLPPVTRLVLVPVAQSLTQPATVSPKQIEVAKSSPRSQRSVPSRSNAAEVLLAPAADTGIAESSAGADVRQDAPVQPADPESANSQTVAIPAPGRQQFDAKGSRDGKAWSGRGELAWAHDGTTYQAVLRTQFGKAVSVARSIGALSDEGIQPKVFSFVRRNSGDQANTQSVWQVPPGAQDPLSVLVHVSSVVAGDPAKRVPGTEIRINLADGPASGELTFVVQERETTALSDRSIPAIKLVAAPGSPSDLQVWLAPEHGYLAVRFRTSLGNGDWSEYVLTGESLN